jgi:hypothetical protein
LRYVTNIVLVENFEIEENFNLVVCQLLVCDMQHPGALAPWRIGSVVWTYLPLEP